MAIGSVEITNGCQSDVEDSVLPTLSAQSWKVLDAVLPSRRFKALKTVIILTLESTLLWGLYMIGDWDWICVGACW